MDTIEKTSERIGREYRERRKAVGLTQVELAARSGITEFTICNLERGQASPTLGTLKALHDALTDAEPKRAA